MKLNDMISKKHKIIYLGILALVLLGGAVIISGTSQSREKTKNKKMEKSLSVGKDSEKSENNSMDVREFTQDEKETKSKDQTTNVTRSSVKRSSTEETTLKPTKKNQGNSKKTDTVSSKKDDKKKDQKKDDKKESNKKNQTKQDSSTKTDKETQWGDIY